MPDVRVASAELFVTNRAGNSPVQSICLTSTLDSGLRTLSGGQYSIQVDGYLAVDDRRGARIGGGGSTFGARCFCGAGKRGGCRSAAAGKTWMAREYCTLRFRRA